PRHDGVERSTTAVIERETEFGFGGCPGAAGRQWGTIEAYQGAGDHPSQRRVDMGVSTTRWSPYPQMERMQRDLDRLYAHVTSEGQPGRGAGWLPAVDVEQTADAMVLKADLPGIPRDAISIEVHDGSLTISGERDEQRHNQHEGYVVHERISGSFARSF